MNCRLMSPKSLQTLSCSEIVKTNSLTDVAAHLMPPLLKWELMVVAINEIYKPDMPGTFRTIKVLLRHWPYWTFDVNEMSKRKDGSGVLSRLVLDQFVSDYPTRSFQKQINPYLCELSMKNGNMLFGIRLSELWIVNYNNATLEVTRLD